ncbi:hypothetical protein [Diaphorobacter sp.]|uniref:hypothetical protein n=1 Tax=Diaphorobacter sp. TaxID=1934310 RepID=UPI002589B6C9|nr:hypothetical protein [Diaphorobacter sp.]
MSAFRQPSIKTSSPVSDPLGLEIPSTRDLLAIHMAAAMYLKDKGWRSNPGESYGREAYKFADGMLKARESLAEESNSQKA